MADSELSPKFAPFIGMVRSSNTGSTCWQIRLTNPAISSEQGGIAAAMIFGCAGAAYGTAKSGIGIAGVGTFRPDLIMKVSSVSSS